MTQNLSRITRLLLTLVTVPALLAACKTDPKAEDEKTVEAPKEAVVEILSNAMDIIMPDTLASGWHNFRYVNKSEDTHFILFDKYPEGRTAEDAKNEVAPAFQKGMDLITAGKPEEGFAEFQKLPTWFFDVVFVGGIGLLGPKSAGDFTMKLDPGYYVVECYVKMPNGMFHVTMGMVTELVVTEEVSPTQAPEADVQITLSGESGITIGGEISEGETVFSLFFEDQKPHENFVGHDINLVKVAEGADLTVLEKWLDWSRPKGLISPAPEGFSFLGGINDMPGGNTGYFKADLSPGNYVLVSEVPNTSQKNMMVSFTVME
jgi:hypothetical protein